MLPIAPDTVLQQRYRILNLLGEGRFGRTYLAADRGRFDAYCAIEELAPFAQFSSTLTKAKAVFKQEAALLYQLQHPQIPRFWTTVEEQNRLLLVRDYIPGKSYQDLLEERRNVGRTFTEAEVWHFLLALLPVIGYIHSKGTIHRDLSPAHIICQDSDRLPVPIDFGVVKEFANKLQVSADSPRIPVGQPGYAPIEQLQSGQVYPNSDLYAVAVTAIVLLTGKEPSAIFSGGKINWEWRKWTDIDDGFANVLGKMLKEHPHDRYQSAAEVEQDLRLLTIANSEELATEEVENDRNRFDFRSPFPSVAATGKSAFTVANRIQSAITNIDVKSIWEQPQVFIPVGILIAILAGAGSWFGVTQLLHRSPSEPVATTPPKQIDFNNPTIPIDTSSPTVAQTDSDTILPEMDRSIEKEGKVDANTPTIYKFAAMAGANLDIQLVPLTAQAPAPTKITLPIDPITSKISPNFSQPQNPKLAKAPIPVATPLPTQVLMTIISPLGSPIDDKADRVLNWRGTLSTSGNYTIELRPIKGLAGGTFPYKLSVTQLSMAPAAAPAKISPNPIGANSTIGAPIPNGNSGLNATPGIPTTISPDNSLPNFPPVVIPNAVPNSIPAISPIEPERPTSKRKRQSIEDQPRRPRERVGSNEGKTPPRQRQSKVTPNQDATPTRQRQNPPPNSDTQPKPGTTNPDLGDNGTGSMPKSEEQIPILVPDAKKETPAPAKTDVDRQVPPASGTNDPD